MIYQAAIAEEWDLEEKPWEKFGANISVFLTGFDLDIYQLACSYSFFQDDRVDLAAGIGVYVMPIDFGIKVSGLVDEEGSEKFTAPLPVFGLRMDVALTPKWFIRSGAQVFYLEYDNFTGSTLEFKVEGTSNRDRSAFYDASSDT